MFFWTIGTTVLVLVIGALSLTRFLSLGCKAVHLGFLCSEAGLIVTLIGSVFVNTGAKALVLYCVVMMRRELEHKVLVVDDAAPSRRRSFSAAPPSSRTYGSIDSISHIAPTPSSAGASTVVQLETDDFGDETDSTNGKLHKSSSPSSSVLGPRLYMNESQRETYEIGLQKFNAKPKRGVEFILSNPLLEILLNVRSKISHRQTVSSSTTSTEQPLADSAQFEAAAIMLSDKAISPIKLGSYLGQSDPTASAIRRAWVARLNFSSLEFDEALRYFLTKLMLPPETEKIDRLIESFALGYHEGNPTVFAHQDTAYILAFGLLMLHTDAHNPSMKKEAKMTKDQFVKNMRGIDQGRDLPTAYLGALFDRIVAEEMMTDVARRGYEVICLFTFVGECSFLFSICQGIYTNMHVQAEEVSIRSGRRDILCYHLIAFFTTTFHIKIRIRVPSFLSRA